MEDRPVQVCSCLASENKVEKFVAMMIAGEVNPLWMLTKGVIAIII